MSIRQWSTFPISRDEVICYETRVRSKTYNTRVAASKWNCGTIQQMHEGSHTGRTYRREVNARCSHNLSSVLPSKATYDNKDKPICSYARGTRDAYKASNGDKWDDIIDREQVVKTKAKTVARDTWAKEHRLKVGDQLVVMQKKKNKLSTVFNPTPLTVTNIKGSMITASKNKWSITRDATKFRKLYGSALHNSKGNEEEIHEAESDTNKQPDHEGDDTNKRIS